MRGKIHTHTLIKKSFISVPCWWQLTPSRNLRSWLIKVQASGDQLTYHPFCNNNEINLCCSNWDLLLH